MTATTAAATRPLVQRSLHKYRAQTKTARKVSHCHCISTGIISVQSIALRDADEIREQIRSGQRIGLSPSSAMDLCFIAQWCHS